MNHACGQLTGNSSNTSTSRADNTVHFHSNKTDKITLQCDRAEIQTAIQRSHAPNTVETWYVYILHCTETWYWMYLLYKLGAKYKLVNYLWDKPQCHSPLALATLLVFQGNYSIHILQPRVRLFGTNTMSNYCILTSHNSTSNIVNEPYGSHRNKHNYVHNVFNVFYCVC